MSAAVARQQQSGHGGSASNSGSRMGSNSPVEKRVTVKAEGNNIDKSTRSPPSNQNNADSRILSPKSTHRRNPSGTSHPPPVTLNQPQHDQSNNATNQTNSTSDSHPPPTNNHAPPTPILPPPPAGDPEKPGTDYFSFHKTRLDQEPNPFEQSFSVTGAGENTPKAILPPASAITSPAPLLGGPSTYGFMNSLRAGPLSPAMLQGPISGNGGLSFDSHIRTGLTPNESGIRSGLTPGGSGSMFPVPSPSPASFLQFGTSTPSTMEFQKTALSAASALRKQPHQSSGLTSIPPLLTKPEFPAPQTDDRQHLDQPTSKPRQYSLDTDPAHHAANGLFMLAQAHQQNDQFPSNTSAPNNNAGQTQGQVPMSSGAQTDIFPNSKKRSSVVTTSMMNRTQNTANNNNMPNNMRGMSEMSEEMGSESEDSDDKGKGGKRGSSNRNRKTDTKANKRAKTSAAGSGDDQNEGENQTTETNTKKMTDEEKRKNFLERNRVAALKCRQRKKQWLQNLQTKVEYYSQENDALTTQVANLREEIVALKTLLLAHKDCPIARTSMGMDTIQNALAAGASEYGNHAQFTSMGMIPPPAVHGHPRRYS